MQVEVQFDKEKYYPGDTVQAQFMISGPYHSRSRGIRLELASGENVGVSYTTGTGDDEEQHTDWSRLVYSRADHALGIPQFESETVDLSYQLPNFPSDNLDGYEFSVYHQAKATLDIARGKDENYYFKIPLISLPPVEMPIKSVVQRSKNFEVTVSTTSGYTGDHFSVQLVATRQKKYRSIRIEMEQRLNKSVGSNGSSYSTKHVMAKFKPTDMVHTELEIPLLPYSTISGEAFEILTYLKIVIDVAMARDENIVLDFPYFKSPRNLHEDAHEYDPEPVKGKAIIFCSNCGTENIPPAKSCTECGEEILYEY